MDSQDLEKLPYDLRRLLTVVEQAENPVTDRELEAQRKLRRSWQKGLGAILPGGALAVMAVDAVVEQSLMRRRMSERLLVKVDHVQASALKLPLGHPRAGIVYAGHPADWRVYVPMADFHRFLFEHKVAEAQRMLRSLGATTINVEHVEGWDQSVGVSASAGIPNAGGSTAKATGGRLVGHERSVMATMELTPTTPPHLPDDLVWISHEPLWKEVADARMSSQLRSFTVDVRSTDDYGIDASLKASVSKAGFDVGGKFKEHTSTIWRMAGTFGDSGVNA